MPLAAGRLNQRVAVQRPTEAHVDGEVRLHWVTVATVWAAVEQLSVRETLAAGAQRGEITHRVLIRHREDPRASWRLVWRARVLELDGPPRDPEGTREYLELLCREVA